MTSPTDQTLLVSRARLPQHVVHRSFVAETVVLNLRTGKYHGLNVTAGRMLEALESAPSIDEAVPGLAAEFEVEEEQVRADLLTLCRGLVERGLVEIEDAAD
jgi:Coenzyme PQQ synthesis protein D (PqqD)